MTDLVSVSGICFVAAESETVPVKHKYRPRGSRTRVQQHRESARNYYRRNREKILSQQRERRAKNRLRENSSELTANRAAANAYYRNYYARHRAHICELARASYRRRKIQREYQQSR